MKRFLLSIVVLLSLSDPSSAQDSPFTWSPSSGSVRVEGLVIKGPSRPDWNELVAEEDHIEHIIASGKKIVLRIKAAEGIAFPANAHIVGEKCFLASLDASDIDRFLPFGHVLVLDSFAELMGGERVIQLLRSKEGIDLIVSYWSSFEHIKKTCSPYFDITLR